MTWLKTQKKERTSEREPIANARNCGKIMCLIVTLSIRRFIWVLAKSAHTANIIRIDDM